MAASANKRSSTKRGASKRGASKRAASKTQATPRQRQLRAAEGKPTVADEAVRILKANAGALPIGQLFVAIFEAGKTGKTRAAIRSQVFKLANEGQPFERTGRGMVQLAKASRSGR